MTKQHKPPAEKPGVDPRSQAHRTDKAPHVANTPEPHDAPAEPHAPEPATPEKDLPVTDKGGKV